VHAICTADGPFIAFKYHPLRDMASPTSKTFTLGCLEAKATTEAGGEPRIYSSGMEVVMALAIVRAQATMERQDSR